MPSSTLGNMRKWTEFELGAVLSIICKGINLKNIVTITQQLNAALNYKRVDEEISRKEVSKLLYYLQKYQEPTMAMLKRHGLPCRVTRAQKLAFARVYIGLSEHMIEPLKAEENRRRRREQARKKQQELAAAAKEEKKKIARVSTSTTRRGSGHRAASGDRDSTHGATPKTPVIRPRDDDSAYGSGSGSGSVTGARGRTDLPVSPIPIMDLPTSRNTKPPVLRSRSRPPSRSVSTSNARGNTTTAAAATGDATTTTMNRRQEQEMKFDNTYSVRVVGGHGRERESVMTGTTRESHRPHDPRGDDRYHSRGGADRRDYHYSPRSSSQDTHRPHHHEYRQRDYETPSYGGYSSGYRHAVYHPSYPSGYPVSQHQPPMTRDYTEYGHNQAKYYRDGHVYRELRAATESTRAAAREQDYHHQSYRPASRSREQPRGGSPARVHRDYLP